MKLWTRLLASAAVLVLAGAAYWFWQRPPAPAPEAAPAPVAELQPVNPELASAPPAAVVERYPLAASPASAAAPTASGIAGLLAQLFGADAMKSIFLSDDFAHRFVATVDGLGRDSASSALWPVAAAAGHFQTEHVGGAEIISGDNAARYARYVRLLDGADMDRLISTYRQLYPQLQQAYRDLGYPKGFFNDRFIAVLDQLIATPVVTGPLRVRRPVIAGSQPAGGHVIYVFDDPAIESMAVGSKILLRMGPINERHVQARLKELRGRLAAGAQ